MIIVVRQHVGAIERIHVQNHYDIHQTLTLLAKWMITVVRQHAEAYTEPLVVYSDT